MFKRSNKKQTEQEKVAERREEVLAQGRKFKYPIAWTRHHIVILTIIVAVISIVIIIVGSWAALYKAGNTSGLLFNVTKVFPLPVAEVEGEPVRFSDYLMFYRSSITSASKQLGESIEGDVTVVENRYKRSALTEAERYVYALKCALETGISVSDAEVAEEFHRHLQIGGIERSEEGFVKILEDNFGITKSEYERMLYLTLMRAKVEQQNDVTANNTAAEVERLLSENGGDYQKVAEALGSAIQFEDTGGLVDNKNVDGGRAAMAMGLEPGQSSGKFVSINGDGFYFVKLLEKTDSKVNFMSIKVPFTEFEQQFSKLQESGNITEFIEIKETEF